MDSLEKQQVLKLRDEELRDLMRMQEDKSRRNNIRIVGVVDYDNES